MANPDFIDFGTEQEGTGAITLNMPPGLAANQILILYVATDGFTPSLSTPNGFVLAQDPVGNTGSVNTAINETGMHLFWKRAVGGDAAPVLAAPTGGGTVQCCHINSYSNCRTSGTPFHKITTATVTSATTTITPPTITTTLNGCTVFSVASSAADDSTFNNWTSTGAATPGGTIDSGWHSALGNDCSWAGGRGGFATAGGPHNCTSTFGTSTVQAQITFALASLAEAAVPQFDDGSWMLPGLPLARPLPIWALVQHHQDELPGAAAATIAVEDYWIQPQIAIAAAPPRQPYHYQDTLPQAAASSVPSEDYWLDWRSPSAPPPLRVTYAEQDDLPAPHVDDDYWLAPHPQRTPWALRWPAADQDEIAFPSLVGVAQVVGAGYAQRSDSAGPETGTLTTAAPPAWAALTSYVVDPTAGGINRVTNGGNLYQCRTSGTSAASGGPTGTGADITDGIVTPAHWTYQGAAPTSDTAAGDLVLVVSARGNQSTASSVPPTDNDGGSYAQIFNREYDSFAGAFAGLWRRNAPANAKAGFTTSLIWGGTSPGSGAGSETTDLWFGLRGVAVGAPHASSQVERAAATGGIVTAASITTTVRCLVVSVWAGTAPVIAAGTSHVAVPQGGLQLVPGANALMSLSTNGYIQFAVAWRIAQPGTSAESWDVGAGNEGAQLFTAAFVDLTQIGVTDGDEAPYWLIAPQPAASMAARIAAAIGQAQDDAPTPVTVGLDDDSWPWPRPVTTSPVRVQVFAEQDEIASLTIDEEYDLGSWMRAIAVPATQRPAVADQDELPALTVDEAYHWTLAPVPPPQRQLHAVFDVQDELGAAPVALDEDYWVGGQPYPRILRAPRQQIAHQDEVFPAPPGTFALDSVTVAEGVGALGFVRAMRFSLDSVALAESVGDLGISVARLFQLGGVSLTESVGDLAMRVDRRFALGGVALSENVGALGMLVGKRFTLGSVSLGVSAGTLGFTIASGMALGSASLSIAVGAVQFNVQRATSAVQFTPLAKLIAKNFKKFGKTIGVKSCTLIKVTPTARVPGSVTTATVPTTVSHAAQGIAMTLTPFQIANSLITDVNVSVMLFGASIAGGAIPAPGDRITIDSVTYTICDDAFGAKAVQGDPVRATYQCACR